MLVGTAYIVEYFPNTHWPRLLFLVLLMQVLSVMAVPHLLSYVQSNDSFKVEVLFLVCGLVSLIFCALFMPDSPHSFWRRG